MPFEPGNNLGGRTKGSINKTNAEIRENFQMLITENLPQLREDLKTMEAEERVKYIIQLSKFVLPTLKAADIKTEDKGHIKIIREIIRAV